MTAPQDTLVMATKPVLAARWAITGVFAVNGLLVATYLVRIPSLQASLRLSDAHLAAILTCWGVTAIVTMQLVGGLVARFGSARLIRISMAALPGALLGVGLADRPWVLAVAVAVGGALVGTLDTAMNAHAVVVERHLGRPILSSCHAAVSGSAIVASAVGAAALHAGISMALHVFGLGVVLLPAGLLLSRRLLPAVVEHEVPQRPADPGSWRAGWTRPVLVLGTLGMVLMLCEAAVISFGGVFLHSERGATLAQAALGYTVFTLFQTLGRLAGDPLTQRLGRSRLFRAHAAIGILGFAVVLVSHTPVVALAGFVVVGYGTSVLVPLVFSATGRAGGVDAARFVARTTTFIYAGILIGPALAGWLGQIVGLTAAFACFVPLLAVVAANARSIGGPDAADRRARRDDSGGLAFDTDRHLDAPVPAAAREPGRP